MSVGKPNKTLTAKTPRIRRPKLSSIRTSQTDPLQIATLNVGDRGGAIGVTFAPGKKQSIAMTGAWYRDLDADLEAIRAWGAGYLITLLEPQELVELSIQALPERAAAAELRWYSLPIADGSAPDGRFLESWQNLGPLFVAALQNGERLVVHCKGGLGRAGTIACLLIMNSEITTDVNEAISRVRAARPGAIETPEQEVFLRTLRN